MVIIFSQSFCQHLGLSLVINTQTGRTGFERERKLDDENQTNQNAAWPKTDPGNEKGDAESHLDRCSCFSARIVQFVHSSAQIEQATNAHIRCARCDSLCGGLRVQLPRRAALRSQQAGFLMPGLMVL